MQGLPQSIQIIFPNIVVAKKLALTFQGGFVGTRCKLLIKSGRSERGREAKGDYEGNSQWESFTTIFPEDVNRKQTFLLPGNAKFGELKLLFEESSDFFGRITLYDVQLDGYRVIPA